MQYAKASSASRPHVTAIVTPNWLDVPFAEITRGSGPLIPAGICTLICITPSTIPGAPPAYCTGASSPPTVAVTGATDCGSDSAATTVPSIGCGFIPPVPVA